MWNPLPAVKRSGATVKLWQAGARILEALGAEEQALRFVDRAVKLDPRCTNLHLLATRLCLKRGRLERAILHWKKAVGEHSRTSLLYWINRADGSARSFNRLLKKKYQEHPFAPESCHFVPDGESGCAGFFRPPGLFGKLLAAQAETPSLTDVGINLLSMNRPEEALIVFRQVQATRGPDAALFFNIGLALSKMGRHEEALLNYQRAQAGGLNNVELMNNKGYSLLHLNRLEEAIACYELARELSPGDGLILTNLAGCYHRAGMYEQAVSCYENALRCRADDATTLNNYALCLDDMGRYEEALGVYERALGIDPENKIVLLNKASTLIKLRRYQQSLATCRRILSREPDCPETWGLLGNLHNEMGEIQEAVKCYSRALGLVH